MIFNRSYSFKSSGDASTIRRNLLGKKINIHDLDFEVIEKESMLKVIPHAEHEEKFRVLPITHLVLNDNGQNTQIRFTSKPRRIDIGGPYAIIIFSLFCVLAGVFLYFFIDKSRTYSMAMTGIGLAILLILWIRMEMGYFDYVRKIKNFVKNNL